MSPFMPHRYCLRGDPALIWATVLADACIALAYYTIPVWLGVFVWRFASAAERHSEIPEELVAFVRSQGDRLRPLILLFAAFIFLCGTTHLMEIDVMYRPDYWTSAVTKIATALVSCATAIFLVRTRF